MTDLVTLAFDWTWDPGLRGVLTVAVAVIILLGSVYLILSTNSGPRLGFLIALTAFAGWMTVMGVIWSIYGIGWKGEAPTWEVVDVVRSEPGSGTVDSSLELARSIPLPDELPDPVEVRDSDADLLAAFPAEQSDPSLGDLVTIDPELREEIDGLADPWRILESSNKYTGETEAVVAEHLGPDGEAVFESAADYVVIESFLTGGKAQRTDDSIVSRATYKVTSTFDLFPPPFYAVVQLQQVVPQETKPGQAPPAPVADPDQPVISVVLERVGGHQLRVPQMTMTFLMGVTTIVLCTMLHRRDKQAQAQRAAAAGAS
ncbi:MAG: hypothetical protein KDA98_03235 [Acidimicrobiales bacterium]|nr:hypothetical protein [Acidimicrobiales bacterium]